MSGLNGHHVATRSCDDKNALICEKLFGRGVTKHAILAASQHPRVYSLSEQCLTDGVINF